MKFNILIYSGGLKKNMHLYKWMYIGVVYRAFNLETAKPAIGTKFCTYSLRSSVFQPLQVTYGQLRLADPPCISIRIL